MVDNLDKDTVQPQTTSLRNIERYIPLADFFSDILGPTAEIVLQDVTNKENSVIYIKNSHISGRKIGSPLTDFALRIIQNREYVDKDFVSNYTGTTKDGKFLQSSTYFIKEEDEIIGMLCVNIDLTTLIDARNMLDVIINKDLEGMMKQNKNETSYKEVFSNDITELVTSMIQQTISDFNIPINRMRPEEKISLVHELDKKGVFLIRGSVQEVSKSLIVSEATIYRYLHKK